FYVNGNMINYSSNSGVMKNYGKNVQIGRFSNLSSYLSGNVDDIRIYNRALSESEIQQLYTESTTSTTLAISGKVTDANGAGISGETVTLSGAATDSKTTDANGAYQFTNLAGGIYKVTPPQIIDYYPHYMKDGSIQCYREVQIMQNSSYGVSEVNFIKKGASETEPTKPFVKLIFPRSGDKLKGDFGLMGTAFKSVDCETCPEIKELKLLANGSEVCYGSIEKTTSGRFALSQVVWRVTGGAPVTAPWEQLISPGMPVTLQVQAINTNNEVGYSELITISTASTTASAVITHSEFTLPIPAVENTNRTLSYQPNGASSVSQTWYGFNYDCLNPATGNYDNKLCVDDPTAPSNRVEYDARFSTDASIHQQYPVEDVYPTLVATLDSEGNTLVDIEHILTYKAARYGDPEANGSGSKTTAYGVNAVSGNLYYETVDMSLEGLGLPFAWARRYNSLGYNSTNTMGKGGWNHMFSYRLFKSKSAGVCMLLCRMDIGNALHLQRLKMVWVNGLP
ncbi:MAG: carboxypeptidase regulatory-like domain-containing protein, partial [Desulfobacterales bacterium]|nr:carboxypeptidase regulatory-like domain-containing protein [Desulfobacterales bacterium]